MRSRLLSTILLVGCATGRGAAPEAVPAADAELDRLAAEVWEATMRRYPTWATFLGDRRYDAVLPDISEEATLAWRKELEAFAGAAEALRPSELTAERQVTAAVVAATVGRELDFLTCARQTWDVDQLDGWQVSLTELGVYQRIDSLAAAADFATRLGAIPALIDQHLDNLRAGMAAGRTAPRVVVERVIAQLKAQLAEEAAASPLVSAADRATLSAQERARLRSDLLGLLSSGVRPALSRYLGFLESTYLPAARPEIGVLTNAGGRGCYEAMVRYHTGLPRSPEEIHQIGLGELARLHGEMNELAREAGHAEWRGYLAALAASPEQYLRTREALLAHNEAIVARATAALPTAFGLLPAAPVTVRALESFREADAPAAYYYPAAEDGSRPAYFYVNTHLPETRPLFNMEALAFHEAVPGHHLQIAIAQKLELPPIRRHSSFTAYVEGWALYAELVASELGLYSSPATRLGMLNYQCWRAARLVVDTGMHALGWSRERAVAFMNDNVQLPAAEVSNEIDRYIIWPGQALAYMLGRMEIEALRRQAEKRLGSRFDVRRFHDAVLSQGALPLDVLGAAVERWIAEQAAGTALVEAAELR